MRAANSVTDLTFALPSSRVLNANVKSKSY
jgi:hypothetical protein